MKLQSDQIVFQHIDEKCTSTLEYCKIENWKLMIREIAWVYSIYDWRLYNEKNNENNIVNNDKNSN